MPGDFKLGNSRVALSGKDVNVRYTRVPRVPDWQLRKLMKFEVAEVGEQSGEGVASDFNLLPELPESGGEDIVLLAMARENLLEEHLGGAKEMGARVESFAPSAVALYNAWLRFGIVQDDTVLVADIGHNNLDVAIVRGPDLLFARNLSGGGELFDQAIASQLSVNAKQASDLKLEHGNLAPGARAGTPNGERVQRAIQGAGGQVLSLLQSAILFCKTQIKVGGLKIDRVMLCGGAAGLEGLTDYLSRGMGVPVELFDPLDALDLSGLDPAQAEALEEYRLEAVTSLGLAVMGADPEAYSLEILPKQVVAKREFWGQKAFLIAAGLMAVAYLGWYTMNRKARIEKGQSQARTLVSKVRRAKTADSQARKLLAENRCDVAQGLADPGAGLGQHHVGLVLQAARGEGLADRRGVVGLLRALFRIAPEQLPETGADLDRIDRLAAGRRLRRAFGPGRQALPDGQGQSARGRRAKGGRTYEGEEFQQVVGRKGIAAEAPRRRRGMAEQWWRGARRQRRVFWTQFVDLAVAAEPQAALQPGDQHRCVGQSQRRWRNAWARAVGGGVGWGLRHCRHYRPAAP